MFPKFYTHILNSWAELRQQPLTEESTLMQHIWYNQFIHVNGSPIKKLFSFELFTSDLFERGVIIPWAVFKEKFDLNENDYFKWRQIISAIPQNWKNILTESDGLINPPKIQHTLQLSRLLPIEKLTSKQLYILLIHKIKMKPTSQIKISEKIDDHDIDWRKVYIFGRKITIDSYGRMFHFKCSHNILFLNKALFKMNIKSTSLCSYCHHADETIVHLFAECEIVKELWTDLSREFTEFVFPVLTPKSAYFGFYDLDNIMVNHIHLIFKIAIYNKRDSGLCSIVYIKNKIISIKNIEENLTYLNRDSASINQIKWARCINL